MYMGEEKHHDQTLWNDILASKWTKAETKSGIMSWNLQKNAEVVFVYWNIR